MNRIMHTFCDVESVQIRNATRNIYSDVLEGILTMRGQLLRCAFDMENWIASSVPPYDNGVSWNPPPFRVKLVSLDRRHAIEVLAIIKPDDDLGFSTSSLGTIYWFPLMDSTYVYGLLLRPVGNVAGRYERCGTFSCWQDLGRDGMFGDGPSNKFWKNVVQRDRSGPGSGSVQPLDVSYLVGPRTEVTKEPEVWKEYQGFDGRDYVFSIV